MAESSRSPDSFVYRTDRPWPNPRLRIASIVGHSTDTSVRLWFRTAQPGRFSLLLYSLDETLGTHGTERALRAALGVVPLSLNETQAVLRDVRREDFEVEDYGADSTHVADLSGLEPGFAYGYALYCHTRGRVVLGHNRLRRLRTPPPRGQRRPFQFAVVSCNMPFEINGLFRKRTEAVNLDMWNFLDATLQRHSHEIDAVIAGGDQAYSDGVDTLDIWKYLNATMRREGDRLLPDLDAMVSWYRDIYRGYWGFESIQRIFEEFPTYMVWDDHEIADGWGSHYFGTGDDSDGLYQMLPDLNERGLTYDDGLELVQRMFAAAKQAYFEYQHSHNPPTADGVHDYAFERGGCAFYVLDGRGQRDISRDSYRILGREQFDRFARWVGALDPEEAPFLFVVSAVPVIHTRASLVNADELVGGLGDDLRDSWEHELHDIERRALLEVVFDAADRGIKVGIISGDVHVSAVFSLDDDRGNRIYQLTSSPITYNMSRIQSLTLSVAAADDGTTDDGYRFRRLALYAEESYALVKVDPPRGEAWFKLYGKQEFEVPTGARGERVPVTHSLVKLHLF